MKQLAHYDLTQLSFAELGRLAEQVGQTPLQPVQFVMQETQRAVYLKLESANPTGSMKDRTGYALIQHLETQGVLNEASVIIESTSGNLGVALAFQCRVRRYPFIAVVDPKATQENIHKMQALGAVIEMVAKPDATGGYLLSRLSRVQELCSLNKNYIWTDQYSSPANPLIHYRSTGPEIYRQMNEDVGAVFVPVSTGGTLAGIGRFFRSVSPATQIVGVDAYGSVIFGTPPAPRKLTGIGSSRRSDFINPHLYDTHMLVKDEEAFAFCRALASATGLELGGSSGATLAACARYLADHPSMHNAVCVCADRGENYASSIYNNTWLQSQGLALSQDHLGPVEAITY